MASGPTSSNKKQGLWHSSSRESWRFAHTERNEQSVGQRRPTQRMPGGQRHPTQRMEREDEQVLDLLQDSIDLETSVLSCRKLSLQPDASVGSRGATLQTPRDDIRCAAHRRDSCGIVPFGGLTPHATPNRPKSFRSTIRLLSSAGQHDDNGQPATYSTGGEYSSRAPELQMQESAAASGGISWKSGMCFESLGGKNENAGKSDAEIAGLYSGGDCLAGLIERKVPVSERALRKLVTAAHHRDVLLLALQSSPSALSEPSAKRGDAHDCDGGRSKVWRAPPDEQVTWGQAEGSTGMAAQEDRRPVSWRTPPRRSLAETVLVREMGQKLEEAVALAEGLRGEKAALQKELRTLHARSTASRKIADKARSGEKDLSESLSTLTSEHRDLVERLILERQEHTTKATQLRQQAGRSSRALAHVAELLVAKLRHGRLRRLAFRAWKACAVESLLALLAKSGLILKCAAVAHTRSSLRFSLRAAARAWSLLTSQASAAALRARYRTSARLRLLGIRALVFWRTWARGLRRAHCYARIVAVVCIQRVCSRQLARVLAQWHSIVEANDGRGSQRAAGAGAWAAGSGGSADQGASSQVPWAPLLMLVRVRKRRDSLRGAFAAWSIKCVEMKRFRVVGERVVRSWNSTSLARPWRPWRRWASSQARLQRVGGKIMALFESRLTSRGLRFWRASVASDLRARMVIAKCVARWTKTTILGAMLRWVRVATEKRKMRTAMYRVLENTRYRGVRAAFCSWAAAWEVACNDQSKRDAEAAESASRHLDAETVWRQRALDVTRRLDEKDAEIATLKQQIVKLCQSERATDDDGGIGGTCTSAGLGPVGASRDLASRSVQTDSFSSSVAAGMGGAAQELEAALLLLNEEKAKRSLLEEKWAADRATTLAAEADVAAELERLVGQLDEEREQQRLREQELQGLLTAERLKLLDLAHEKIGLHDRLEAQRAAQEILTKDGESIEKAHRDLGQQHALALEQLENERRQRQLDREMLVREVSCERALVWRMMDSMQRRRELREAQAVLLRWRAYFTRNVKARLKSFLQARRALCRLFFDWADAVALERERELVREREREQQIALALEAQLEHQRASGRMRQLVSDAETQCSPLLEEAVTKLDGLGARQTCQDDVDAAATQGGGTDAERSRALGPQGHVVGRWRLLVHMERALAARAHVCCCLVVRLRARLLASRALHCWHSCALWHAEMRTVAWQNKLFECARIVCAWKTGVLVEKLCCQSDSEVGELVHGGAEMVEDGFVPAENAVQADIKAEMREDAVREDAMRACKGRRDAFICLESEDDLYEMVEEGSVQLSSDDDCEEEHHDDCEEEHHVGRISAHRGTGTVDAVDSDMAGSLTGATVDSERNGEATGASQSRMAGASRLADEAKRLADEASSALARRTRSTSPAGSAAVGVGLELDGVADLAHDDDGAPHAKGSGVQEVWGQDSNAWQGTFEQEVALVRLRCEQDLLQEKQALASKLRLAYETLAPLRSEVLHLRQRVGALQGTGSSLQGADGPQARAPAAGHELQGAWAKVGLCTSPHLSMDEGSGTTRLSNDGRRSSSTEQLSDLFLYEQEDFLMDESGQGSAAAAGLGAAAVVHFRLPSADSQCSPPPSPVFQSPMQHDPPRETAQRGFSQSPTRQDARRHHTHATPTDNSPTARKPTGVRAHSAHRRLEPGTLSSACWPPGPPGRERHVRQEVCQGRVLADSLTWDEAVDQGATPLPRLPLSTRPHPDAQHKPRQDGDRPAGGALMHAGGALMHGPSRGSRGDGDLQTRAQAGDAGRSWSVPVVAVTAATPGHRFPPSSSVTWDQRLAAGEASSSHSEEAAAAEKTPPTVDSCVDSLGDSSDGERWEARSRPKEAKEASPGKGAAELAAYRTVLLHDSRAEDEGTAQALRCVREFAARKLLSLSR